MTTKRLNRNHLTGCLCFFCVQARKRYTRAEWDAVQSKKDCIHCGYQASGYHAASWEDQGMTADGGCMIKGLKENGISSGAFDKYEQRFSNEYTFDPVE